MKSFFKKLAFVMALAMVVTLAAPAAQSALAANVITYAYQEGGAVSTLNMKANDEVDLKFIGAPANWKTLGWAWESSNTAVATVDKAGVVTAVADGTAVITCTIGDSTTAGVAVTVGTVATVNLGTSKTDVFTEKTVKVGDSVDLNFYGVTDWSSAKYSCTWVSTEITVANVDAKGVVTAVAAGTTKVTCLIKDKVTGALLNVIPVDFTVTAAEVTPEPTVAPTASEFTVKQLSMNSAKLTFETAPTAELVEAIEVIWMVSDVEISLTTKSITLDGNVATVVLNDSFYDGDSYKVVCGGSETSMTASAGDIASVAFTYYTDDETEGAGVAYVSTDDENSITTLVPHFYDENNVDVTALYDIADFDITYEVAKESDAFDLVDNEITFNAVAQAVINMTVAWTDDEAEEHILRAVNVVVGTKRPAVKVSFVAGGFLEEGKYLVDDDDDIEPFDDFTTNKDSYFWKNNLYLNTWVLGDEINDDGSFKTLQIAALMKDNRGNTITSGVTCGEGEGEYPYGSFIFASSKETVLGVTETGELSFYEAGTANVLVYFVPADAENVDADKVLVGAIKITVKPERYVARYEMTTDSATMPVAPVKTDEKDDKGNDIYTANAFSNNATFVLKVFDQYGRGFEIDAGDITIKATSPSESTNTVELEAEYSGGDGNHGWEPHYHIVADADDFASQVKTSSSKTFKYTVTVDTDQYEKLTTKSDTFSLKLTNVATYKTKLDAFLANPTAVGHLETFYYNLSNKTSSQDLAVKNIVNFSSAGDEGKAVIKEKDISIKYMSSSSNGLTLENVPYANILPMEENQTTGKAGYVYYKNTTASNKIKNDVRISKKVDGGGNPIDGKLYLSWNTVDRDGIFTYAQTGTYKVTLYTAKEDGAKLSGKTYTYNVTNSQAEVLFAGFDSDLGNETDIDITAEISDAEVLSIIKDNLVFTLEGKVLDLDNTDIVKGITWTLGSKTEKSFTIRTVNITIRLDDGNSSTGYIYLSENINVGKTIREK